VAIYLIALARGGAAAAFGDRDPRLIITRPLPPIDMVLVAHKDHPVHRLRGNTVDRERLSAFVEVLVADSGARDGPPPTRLAKIGSPNVFELGDFDAKRRALLHGLGFGWLPMRLASDDMSRGDLVAVRFDEGNRYSLEPMLAHRRDVPQGPAARALLEDFAAENVFSIAAPQVATPHATPKTRTKTRRARTRTRT
jgi:DNA-binding transcriptional LysR family regulator